MSSQGSIALYDALRDAQGVSEEKARAAASSVPAADNLATREDLATLRGDLQTSHAGIMRTLITFGSVLTSLLTGLIIKLIFFP